MKKLILLIILCFLNEMNASENTVNLENFARISAGDYSMEDPYIFEGKKINIAETLMKIEKEFELNSSHNMIQNSWECESHGRQDKSEGLSVHCEYLGSWAGCHIIFRSWSGIGAPHTWSNIGIYSIKNDELFTKKIIFSGCNANNGIHSAPIFDGKGNIYFYANLSIHTVAEVCGIDMNKINESKLYQGANEFWNISRCEYNIRSGKLRILSILIDPNILKDCPPDIKNLLSSFSKAPTSGEMFYISGSEIPKFLQKFKNNYVNF